jgi:hypothetical protein
MIIQGRFAALALMFVAMTFSAEAFGADQYLCLADFSTGFAPDKATKKWKPTEFDISKHRYVAKKAGDIAKWNEFGAPDFLAIDCSPFGNAKGIVVCESKFGTTILFNENSLRYQKYYEGSYMKDGMLPSDSLFADDTPLIEIGTCSPL